jgi:hypothetical protein
MKNFPKILKALRNESRAWQVTALRKVNLGRPLVIFSRTGVPCAV